MGKPTVTAFEVVQNMEGSGAASATSPVRFTMKEIYSFVAGAESCSGILFCFIVILLVTNELVVRAEHPLAQAVLNYTKEFVDKVPTPAEFKYVAGCGIIATINGHSVAVGNRALMKMQHTTISLAVDERLKSIENQGSTAIILGVDGGVEAVLSITDPVKVCFSLFALAWLGSLTVFGFCSQRPRQR